MQTIAWCLVPFIMMAAIVWIMFVLSVIRTTEQMATTFARQAQALETIARHVEALCPKGGDLADMPK